MMNFDEAFEQRAQHLAIEHSDYLTDELTEGELYIDVDFDELFLEITQHKSFEVPYRTLEHCWSVFQRAYYDSWDDTYDL